jgi:hypothetical protein
MPEPAFCVAFQIDAGPSLRASAAIRPFPDEAGLPRHCVPRNDDCKTISLQHRGIKVRFMSPKGAVGPHLMRGDEERKYDANFSPGD